MRAYSTARRINSLFCTHRPSSVTATTPACASEPSGASSSPIKPFEIAPGGRKREAIECYFSQLQGLGDLVLDAYEPERYWTLVRTS